MVASIIFRKGRRRTEQLQGSQPQWDLRAGLSPGCVNLVWNQQQHVSFVPWQGEAKTGPMMAPCPYKKIVPPRSSWQSPPTPHPCGELPFT